MTAAVHQVSGTCSSVTGVVERLKDSRNISSKVIAIHRVDGVGESLADAMPAAGCKGRSVFDVPALGTVVPVHRRNVMAVWSFAGNDRSSADRCYRGKRSNTVVDINALGKEFREHWCFALSHGALKRSWAHGVDHDQNQTALAHLPVDPASSCMPDANIT
jgi:hypothetical protein